MGAWLSGLGETIASASPFTVFLVVGGCVGAAVVSAWSALRALSRARVIEDTPTAKVRSAPQGYVELWGVGRQMDGPPMIAPLSGLPCVWYRYRIEEQQAFERRGRTETRWVTVEQGQSDDLFWLEDATGRVVVDPEGAEVTPKAQDVWYSAGGRTLRNEPAFIAAYFLRRPGVAPHRFTEERLGERQGVYALGLLRSVRSEVDMPTVEQETVALLRQWKSDQAALKARFDLNHDGTIDQNEWMLARASAARGAESAARRSAGDKRAHQYFAPDGRSRSPVSLVRLSAALACVPLSAECACLFRLTSLPRRRRDVDH